MKARRRHEGAAATTAARQRTRWCAVSRARRPEGDLLRFVVAPDGRLVPDLAADLPGRGLWITARRDRLLQALRGPAGALFPGGKGRADPALVDDVERLLARRCLSLLGLAARAGVIALGFDPVKRALKERPVAALIEAADGAAAGRAKLMRIAAHGSPMPAVIGCFDGRELGLALGRDYVVHAALEKGGLATRFLAESRRLSGFRDVCPAAWGAASDATGSVAP